MIILFTIVHVIVCLFLVIVVLLQSGKAADLAGAFGGMGSQTAFGPRGAATVLSKATTISAALFMVTSLTLSVLYTRAGGGSTGTSVLEKAPITQTAPAPKQAAPAPQAPIKVDLQTQDGKTVSTQEIPLPNAPKSAPAQTPAAPKK
ncbi:preprotein translocase subunit SecG [Paludibaculum fermentans]|uniref:Protein-export membrane protein SecG n=1 Tax=Paludibaculum fermentans TaxID=1473598 RepID=A0A7S7NLJ7_PALFE|nr:preprotein translocase subunit SecG [Paludibaculum fermentans]QOY85847.1 preprotein translocase subunit SecG [Paludibaculum fermentans]